jgi:hypothetical protein
VKGHVHYEAAFEQYLQAQQIPYVAVDESHQATFRDAKLKSFDFIVYSSGARNWLVDIKGRRWGRRGRQTRPAWENWVTQADLDGLRQWEEVFGPRFAGLLVFAYWIPREAAAPAEVVHVYRDTRYVFAGVPLEVYQVHARVRSPRWGTVSMPTREFAAAVRPIQQWL